MRFFHNMLFFLLFVTTLLIVYYIRVFPNISIDENIRVKHSENHLIRGKYLVNHIAACTSCHGTRNWNLFSAPVIPGTEGVGGAKADYVGLSNVITKNITPFNLGFWIDGEIIRAITSGIDYRHVVIHPFMPYENYNHLMENDTLAIVAYIRNLPGIISPKYKSEIDFYHRMKFKLLPKRYIPLNETNHSNEIERGKYLTTIASCARCHLMTGKKNYQQLMAGGKEFLLRTGGKVYAANITPDKATGVGSWSKEKFIQKFKSYTNLTKITSNDFNTVMPWYAYSGMSNSDLSAIYSYLMTLSPISNKIEKFIPDDL